MDYRGPQEDDSGVELPIAIQRPSEQSERLLAIVERLIRHMEKVIGLGERLADSLFLPVRKPEPGQNAPGESNRDKRDQRRERSIKGGPERIGRFEVEQYDD